MKTFVVYNYVVSNSVLVVADDGDTTSSAVSPTWRGAPRKYVWNAESPTKRILYIMPFLKCECFGSAA